MGASVAKDVPEVQYSWTYKAKAFYNDTTPIVSGDGSTVALYSRGENQIHVIDGNGTTLCSIKLQQKVRIGNVSAIPSLSADGSRIVTRDSNSVKCFDRSGNLLWEYERKDKIVRSGMQSWIAQISANGKVAIVRMFHELIWLNGDTGDVMASTQTVHQMASSIPRISDDGTTVVVADGPRLLGFVNCVLAWEVQTAPEASNFLFTAAWSDPGLSGDGNTVGVLGQGAAFVFNAKTGTLLGQITGTRNQFHENSCELAFSHDGSVCAAVMQDAGIAVFSGPGYSQKIFEYHHKGGQRPVAPLLTRDGKTLASKCGSAILVFDLLAPLLGMPNAAARVNDDSAIPGGPTVHSKDYHHDRDTHHKRTFSCSNDGTLCVAVAKHKALWAFNLRVNGLPQGGAIPTAIPVATAVKKEEP